jgi:hypothetical protein
MTNKEKLEALKAFLIENKIEFEENYKSRSKHVVFDLRIGSPRIAIIISNNLDNETYRKIRKGYDPFLIRDNETVEFIIEKMKNCIVDRMMLEQKRMERETKKKEARCFAAECERRHQEKLARKTTAKKPKRKRVRIVRYEKVEPKKK